MAMDDDTLTRPLSPSEIIRDLRENPNRRRSPAVAEPPPATTEPAEEFGPERYDPTRKDYKAFGWAGNSTVPSIRFIAKDQSERAFSFTHLDSHEPGGCEFIPSERGRPNVIRLRFAGASSVFMVFIEGRNLHRGWELIIGHQTPWVAEYPGDMDTLGNDEPVVKSIRFELVK